jgi:pimeloyl-ACP methyl ester carboxylesterase
MKTLLLLIWVMALAGCASAPSSRPIFDAHIAQFKITQPHNEHSVARRDGHRIQAREFNAMKKGQAPTLVMMHGFPDNQHLYDLLIPELSQNYHLVSFDFLGWGASEKPPSHVYNVASQREDLEAVIKQIGLNKVVLVLHDLSGQSGIDWALDNESQTTALVLLNTYYSPMSSLVAPEAIQFYATPSWLRDIAVWGATKSGGNFQNGVGGQLARFFSNTKVRDAFTPIITNASVSIRPAFFSSTSVLWQELEARRALVARVQQFKKPVHIIFGADDPYLNTGVARDFKQLFSNSSLDLVTQAGHYVQLDRAEEVGRLVRERLSPP